MHKRTPRPLPMADYKGREGVAGSVRSKSEHGFRRGLGRLKLVCIFFQEPEEVVPERRDAWV